MKILVPIKRVPDPQTTINVKADGSGIVTDNVKWVVNPFDEYGIEEALRIKEKNAGSEVVLVSIGTQAAQEQLRTGTDSNRRPARHAGDRASRGEWIESDNSAFRTP